MSRLSIYFLASIVLVTKVVAQETEDEFIRFARQVVSKDSITTADIAALLRYDSSISALHARSTMSTDLQILFKRIHYLIEINSLKDPQSFNALVKSLEPGPSYTYALLEELGSDVRMESEQELKYKQIYFTFSTLLGNGFQLDKATREFHYRPLWGWDAAVNLYPFHDKNYQIPTRTFLTAGAGQLFMIKETEGVLYYGVHGGIGRDMKNFNSISLTYEYLIDYNGEVKRNYHGLNACVTSDAFTFGMRTYYVSDQRLFFLMVKYDLTKLLGKRRF